MNIRTATVLTGSRPRFVAEVLPETVSLETKQLVAYGQKRHWQVEPGDSRLNQIARRFAFPRRDGLCARLLAVAADRFGIIIA